MLIFVKLHVKLELLTFHVKIKIRMKKLVYCSSVVFKFTCLIVMKCTCHIEKGKREQWQLNSIKLGCDAGVGVLKYFWVFILKKGFLIRCTWYTCSSGCLWNYITFNLEICRHRFFPSRYDSDHSETVSIDQYEFQSNTSV